MTFRSTQRDDSFFRTTLAAEAQALAESRPDDVAIWFDNGDSLTFGDAWREGRALAAALAARGLAKGDVISFQLPNWRESVAVDLAASILGLVINPIVPIYRDRELQFILKDTGAKALIIPREFRRFDYAEMMSGLRAELPALQHVITARDPEPLAFCETFEALMREGAANPASPVNVDPSDIKIVMYTSGTTGSPKAVRHTHETLKRSMYQGVDGWNITAADRMLMPSPVTHVTGFVNGIELPFLSPARSILMETWNVDRAIEMINELGATTCVSATPFLQELVAKAEATGSGLSGFRLFACGGAAVPPRLIRQTHEILDDCRAFRVYGSTEAPLVSVGFLQPEQEQFAAETDGEVFNYEVRILDDDDNELPLGSDGNIVVKGPVLMVGYGKDEQTREAMTADGYFRTGDIGHLTPENAIVITDRKKDIIIRGGENLSAREIEEVLYGHPAFADVSVVSMPHERLGEGVCAFVIVADGHDCPDPISLRPYLEQCRLAKQKWPERIEPIAEFPKTPSGKVKKDILRNEIKTRLAQG